MTKLKFARYEHGIRMPFAIHPRSHLRESLVHAENHFSVREGPLAVIRSCNHCKHFEIVRKGLHGVGRGYGMREGNKARGRIIQHIKLAHADKLVPGKG